MFSFAEIWVKHAFVCLFSQTMGFSVPRVSVHMDRKPQAFSGQLCIPSPFSTGTGPSGCSSKPQGRVKLPESSESADGMMWEYWAENSSTRRTWGCFPSAPHPRGPSSVSHLLHSEKNQMMSGLFWFGFESPHTGPTLFREKHPPPTPSSCDALVP